MNRETVACERRADSSYLREDPLLPLTSQILSLGIKPSPALPTSSLILATKCGPRRPSSEILRESSPGGIKIPLRRSSSRFLSPLHPHVAHPNLPLVHPYASGPRPCDETRRTSSLPCPQIRTVSPTFHPVSTAYSQQSPQSHHATQPKT